MILNKNYIIDKKFSFSIKIVFLMSSRLLSQTNMTQMKPLKVVLYPP